MPEDEITSDAVTADFRILQRRRGHRFSLDDLATAWVAARARADAAVTMDLGCGIGSVLLMIAWRFPAARVFGIEAQDMSAALARRNVALNGIAGRTQIDHGDLRDLARDRSYPPCDLVTGTPPYLPPGTAILSPDPQRAAARVELRGGVEDYLAAAARVLSADGRAVVCADGRFPRRVLDGARAAGLAPLERLDVFARAGAKDPLLAVWTLRHGKEGEAPAIAHHAIAMRDERGDRTEASKEMRRFFGLEAPSA